MYLSRLALIGYFNQNSSQEVIKVTSASCTVDHSLRGRSTKTSIRSLALLPCISYVLWARKHHLSVYRRPYHRGCNIISFLEAERAVAPLATQTQRKGAIGSPWGRSTWKLRSKKFTSGSHGLNSCLPYGHHPAMTILSHFPVIVYFFSLIYACIFIFVFFFSSLFPY